MTDRDMNRGDGFGSGSGSTYASGGNPARDTTQTGLSSSGLSQPVQSTADEAKSEMNQAASGIKEKAAEDWRAVKENARGTLSQATDKAKDAAVEQKNYAAQRVAGLATAIEKVGAELEQGDQADIGRYARQVGSSVQRFADDMKGKDMGEVVAMAEDFGRKQPLAFLGIAAIAGLAASRFLTASAQRRSDFGSDTASVRTTSPTGNGSTSMSNQPMGHTAGYSTEQQFNG